MNKYILLALVLLGCSTKPTSTTPHFSASRPIDRAVHATVAVQTLEGRTYCSGTIVQGTGLVLSAAHCFDEGRKFRLSGLHGTYSARVVVLDTENDVAVLRPLDVAFRRGDGVPLAKSPARMGDRTFALGHARGDEFPFTLTEGIVSFPHRTDNGHYVQATTPLVGGMSGGGFYNARGELLGANLFNWLTSTYCQSPPCGQYQDSPMYGFSYLPIVKDAIDGAR